MTTYVTCGDCDGLGYVGNYGVTVVEYTCVECGGIGEVPEEAAPFAVDSEIDAEVALDAALHAEELSRWAD